jgi:hypothetical protein
MAVNLVKSVTNLTKAVKKRNTKASEDLQIPTDSIIDFTKKLDDWNKETKKDIEECEANNAGSRPTKKKKQVKGSHKVQARPARPLTGKAVARMAKKVIDQSPCGSIQYELVVAVASQIGGITDWVQLIINILQDCVDIYELCYSYANFDDEIAEVNSWVVLINDLPFIGGTWVTDFAVWLLDLLIWVLQLPKKIVLFFSPLNEFLKVLIKLLTMFKEEINRFIANW